jgi:hypothetical protein
VQGTLASQYPSVYGGIFVIPTSQTHFVIVETVHDPSLEAEAQAAYPPGLNVSFQLAQRSLQCLQDIQKQVETEFIARHTTFVNFMGDGLQEQDNQVNVDIATCAAAAVTRATSFFAQRWGTAVMVSTCQQPLKPF